MDNHNPAPETQVGIGEAQAPPEGAPIRGDPTPFGELWTEEEITFLKKNYSDKGPKEIARLLRRTVNAVRKRAQAMSLHKRKAWTEKELDFIREKYSTTPNNELAKTLGRSSISVKHVGLRLGLCKDPYFKSLFFVRPPTVGSLSAISRSYVACAIDGEGYIGIYHRGGSSNVPRPCVGVDNTSEPFIRRLRGIIGAGGVNKRREQTPNSKPLYSLQVYSILNVKSLLEQIKDFLIIKRKIAELVLRYIDLHTKFGYSPEMDDIIKEVRCLNQGGRQDA